MLTITLSDTQHIRNKVLKVAQHYKGQVTFAISNEVEFEDDLKSLGLEDSGAEINAGMYQSERERYRMPPTDDFKSGTLRNFVESVLQGKLKAGALVSPLLRVALAQSYLNPWQRWSSFLVLDNIVMQRNRLSMFHRKAKHCSFYPIFMPPSLASW